MDAKRITHVVRVVIANDQLDLLLGGKTVQQQLAEVVIITAARKHTAVIAGHLRVQGALQLLELRPAAAETNFLLPGLQRQGKGAGNVIHGPVKIEDQCGTGLAHAVCSCCHWVSLSKWCRKRFITLRSSGFLTHTRWRVNVNLAPRLDLTCGSVHPAT